MRKRAVAPELAGAWVNSSANVGIAGGAAISAGLLPVIDRFGVAVLARKAFPAEA